MSAEIQRFIKRHLRRFIREKKDKREELLDSVLSLYNEGYSQAEIFRIISEGKGPGKSHTSGKFREGKIRHS